MRTYDTDYKLILVGDATMSPYGHGTSPAAASSIGTPKRQSAPAPDEAVSEVRLDHPVQSRWRHTASIDMTRDFAEGRMYPLTWRDWMMQIGALS